MSNKRRRSLTPLLFIFFAMSCLNPISTAQVRSEQITVVSDHVSSSLCISDRYIMQSYFTTHTSLSDSEFRDFLFLHECSQDADTARDVSSSLVQYRDMIGEGSHRNLVTTIKLLHHSESLLLHDLVIVEKLPLGVFADPFELQSRYQSRGYRDVSVFGDTNLELPSFRSNSSVVEIHVEISSKDYENGEISVKLPLHARYQPLEESGYSRVEFGEPDLFLCSSYVPNQKHEQRRCLVLSIGGSKTETRSVVWDIPAGIKNHTDYVSVFTFVAAVLSAFSIVVASVLSSKDESCKNTKQS